MKRFLILGAGRQGCACAAFLLEQFDETTVDFVDVSAAQLNAAQALMREPERVALYAIDVAAGGAQLSQLMQDAACVVSCVPYFLNVELTRAAIDAGACFTDLGGNVGTVRTQLAMADACRTAGVAIAPDCGLAPGLLNILAEYWQGDWDYQGVRLYCGGLPQNPHGQLRYAMTFSIHGLLNEYLDDCQVARAGRLETIPGLSEPERLNDLALPGEFEAFATSGGASLGAELAAARGIDYQYKTIRHPGHRDIILSLWEQGFFSTEPESFRLADQDIQAAPRDLSGQIMERRLKSDGADLVVARVDVAGTREGKPVSGRIDLLDYAVDRFTAMERTTGFPTAVTAAALAGLYDNNVIEPGAYVPLQIIDPRLMIRELARGGVAGLAVRSD